MSSIDILQTTAQTIDIAKRKLEVRFIPQIKSIFNNLAKDAEALYMAVENIPANELAKNYTPEFISEIRKIYRRTIKEFGFEIRKTTEKKYNMNFETKSYLQIWELEVKQKVEIQDDELDNKLQEVNNKFQEDATFYVANEPEAKSEYITDTNEKMITAAIIAATALYNTTLNAYRQEGTPEQAQRFQDKKKSFIAKQIAKDIKKKAQSRAELITEDAVGTSEAWSRQREAELVNQATIITTTQTILQVKKRWDATLDGRTRETHAIADGQVVNVDDFFLVGGFTAKMPRDPNLPPKESIRCRCIADYEV
jgi:uncharacterized protein with gpF-like domain